jgi:hypothetical protein
MQQVGLLLRVAPVFLVASACSSSIVGESWPDQSWPAMDAFEFGEFMQAAEDFESLQGDLGGNEFLALAEAGMASHAGGDLDAARAYWLEAEGVLGGFEGRPTLSGRSVAEGAVSMTLNDRALPYDGEDFEAALLHAFLAWDFLRSGDLDGAMVEVRHGYEVETSAEDKYGTDYAMNRFNRFVAALAQEADLAWDDAILDWKALLEEMPDSKALSLCLEHAEKARAGAAPGASIVLIHEKGHMPSKESHSLDYRTQRSMGHVVAPAFSNPMPSPGRIELWVDGKSQGRTFVLEDVHSVAKENLADRIAWIAGKSVIRAAIKTALVDKIAEDVEEEKGFWAGLGVGLLGSLLVYGTEQADLRSWQTLPQQIQALRVPVEPGSHHLALKFKSRGEDRTLDLGEVHILPGSNLLLTARTLRRTAMGQVGNAPAVLLSPANLKP